MKRNEFRRYINRNVRINYLNDTIIGTVDKVNNLYIVIQQPDGKKRHAHICHIYGIYELDKNKIEIPGTRFVNY